MDASELICILKEYSELEKKQKDTYTLEPDNQEQASSYLKQRGQIEYRLHEMGLTLGWSDHFKQWGLFLESWQ